MAAEPLVGLQVCGKVKNQAVPLKSCSVKASVNGYLVGLNSTLTYFNNESSPLEVMFRFPVDQSFAVVGLEAVIAGKRIKAQIKEKEEAKQVYDDAIGSGFTAALAEEKSGDIFSISLGNLPPQGEAELYLKLVGELPIDSGGEVRFSLPAVLKPRYTPSGSSDPLAVVDSAGAHKQTAAYHFEMVVKKEGVSSVTSPTHDITSNVINDSFQIALAGSDKPLDKDLVVLILHEQPHLPKAVCELGVQSQSQRSYMGAPAVMLSFFPEFESKRAACEFVFLVDRSGSMRGSYIRSARETLVLFLKSIPPGCSFNIIGFGSRFTSLFPTSVSYNQENLDVAIRHAETVDADLGGTELLGPLEHIFHQPFIPGLPRQVFVLTDGSVSNTHACIAAVKKNVSHTRVFTFGIGSGASTALVNGLAKAGNGTAEFIKEGERMQPKVIGSLKRALQPSVTSVEVEFQLPFGFEVIQAPAKIPTIFNGDKVVVYGIFKSKATTDAALEAGITGTATLKGQILSTPISHTLTFDVPAPSLPGEVTSGSQSGFEIPVIHHLAAKSLLNDWSHGQGWSSTALPDECKLEMIKLSIEANVITEHTAFVAYDEDQSQVIEGAIQVWDLAAPMAREDLWSSHAVFGAAFKMRGIRGGGGGGSYDNSRKKCKKAAFSGPPPPGGLSMGAPMGALGAPMGLSAMGGPPPPPAMASFHCAPMTNQAFSMAPPPPPAMESRQPMRMTAAAPRMASKGARSSASQSTPESLSSDTFTMLISLQQAAGFWLLSDITGKVMKKKAGLDCPPNVAEDVWGTILALAYLEVCCAQQQDEWELIAMKADMWLESQSLPEGVSLISLKYTAKTVVKQ